MRHFLRKEHVTKDGRSFWWAMGVDDLYVALGLPKNKLPRDFSMPPTEVTGVLVYITRSPTRRRTNAIWSKSGWAKSSKHRAMTICPVCGKHTSFGRFQQHFNVHR